MPSTQNVDSAISDVLEAGWKTLWSAWGAESGTIRFGLDMRDVQRGGGQAYVREASLAAGQQREQEVLSTLDDLSANSKLAQRDPLLYEEAVRAMSQDGAVTSVYIPASGFVAAAGGTDVLFGMAVHGEQAQAQGNILDDTLTSLGITREDVAAAYSSGRDLVVPIEKYAATVAQHKEFAGLIQNDRRLTPDGFTVHELQQWAKDNQESLRDAIAAANVNTGQTTQHETETQEIHWAVQQTLETAGQPRDVASANAVQVAAVFGTLAQRTGMSPMQLWSMYAPDVAQEGRLTVEAGEVLPMGDAVQLVQTQQPVQPVNIAYTQEGVPSVVGRITPEMAQSLPLQKQGDIHLDDDALAHIEQEHGQQIRDTGFTDARAFVFHVLGNVGAVYQGKTNRTFELVSVDEKPNNRVITRLEFEEDGDFYRVKTAGPVKPSYYKNKTPLWERAHPALFQEENPLATRRASQRGQSSVVSDVNISVGGDNVNPLNLAYQQDDLPSVVGRITPEMSTEFPLQKTGNILLDDAGITHIERKHGQQIRAAGFAGARNFVNYVLGNVDAVYQGTSSRAFQLVVRDKNPYKQAVIRLEFSESGDFYRVVTAGPERQTYFKNKALLWERAPTNHSQKGTPGAVSGQNSAMSKKSISSEPSAVNAIPRGRINFSTPSGRPLITLFQQADASTFLHESGHLYLEMLRSLGTATNAAPEIADLWQEAFAVLERVNGQSIFDDTGNISKDTHELWATSLENYFRKGEAPSLELRTVFQKFGAWLKAIYNAFRSFNVKPADDLDAVFQRLLATDAQIAEVQQWHDAQKPWSALMDANEEQAARLAKRKQEAREESGDKRMQTLTRAYIAALGGRKRFIDEAKTTVNAMPVYSAMDAASKGVGLDRDIVYALMGEEYGKVLGKKRRTLLRVDGGDDPLILAAQHGFDSTEDMLDAMLKAETKGKAIARLVEQQEQSARDTIAQGVAEQETMPGDVEYHSDAQLSVLLAEQQLLAQKTSLRQQARDASLEAKALRDAARQHVAGLPVAQAMQARRHSLAERRAAKAAWAAAKEGNWGKAAKHKRQEAVSHALYLASMDARTSVEKVITDVKKLVSAQKLSADARDLMCDIAYRFGMLGYGVGNVGESYAAWQMAAKRDGRTFPPLSEWAELVSELGYPIFIEDFILNGGPAQDYRQISLADFESVVNAINNIYKVDRLENTAELNGKRVEIAELVNALESSASTHKSQVVRDKYKSERIKEGLGGLHAAHAKMEAILLDLDGWKHGVWWKTFFLPIADAESHQNQMLQSMNAKLKDLVQNMMPGILDKRSFFNDRFFIEGTGGKKGMTMNEIVAAALNTGNSTNKQRLLEGEEWTQDVLDSVLSHMEEKHWNFVIGVWDYFDTFKEESFALQREVTGVTPKAVVAEPFSITTADGKDLSIPGGYYPIAYSPKHGQKAFAREQKELDAQLFGGRNYGAAMTKHGHLKERSTRGTGERLNLDISVIADHLYNTAHDISHRKAVIEVAKIMRNKSVMDVVERYAGPEVARQFKPWIQDVANEMQAKNSMGWINNMLRWFRRGASIMAMGLKVATAYVQITGFAQTMAVLGSKFTALGYHQAFAKDGSIFNQANKIKEMSPFMASRLTSFDREVREATKNVTLRGSVLGNAEKIAYLPMGIMQFYGVDVPTWLGAHAKALSEGKDDIDAVAYADSIVRLTQTSGGIKDLARVQRGTEAEKVFTMYYSFFSSLYQLAWRAKSMAKNEGAVWLAGQALLLWFVPAVIGELMTGRGPDDDEGEEWAPWIAKKICVYPAQMLIGVRDLVNAVAEPEFGYRGTPAVGTPQSIVRFVQSVQKAVEEDDPSLTIKPGIKMLGHVSILPLGQGIITIGNMYDYMTGYTPDFQLRDLFFTKQKSRR